MKHSKILVSAVALTLLAAGGTSALAAEYSGIGADGVSKAKTTGKIEFTEGKTEIVDPEDPEKEVDPVDPNENTGDLLIQYVSDFEFGQHKKSIQALAQPAELDVMKDGSKTVPFISTKDMRTDRGKGWVLSVTASEFTSIAKGDYAGGVALKGGEVVLNNASYAGTDEAAKPQITDLAKSPTLASGLRLQPGAATTIAMAEYDEAGNKNEGFGTYSLAFGSSVAGQEKDGVTFVMPEKTAVDSAEYQATFDWELAPAL